MSRLSLIGIFKMSLPIIIIFLFSRCMHDEYDFSKLDDDIQIKAGLLTPLAYGTLTFEDIISEFDSSSLLSTDADGLLMLTYEDSLISFIADDMLNIPSQDFLEFFIKSDFNIPAGFGTGDTLKQTKTKKFPFSFNNGEQLDSMILDEGDMVFNITSEFKHRGTITISSENIRRDNAPFERTIPMDDTTGNFTYNEPFALDGYTIYLNDSSGTDEKFIPVDFYVEIIKSTAGITDSDSINITASLENMDFDVIFGYIGNYELLSQPGEVDLGFFQSSLNGYIRFEDPQINFNITNSFGVPAAVEISRFTGFKSSTDSIQMEFKSGFSPFSYSYPSLSPDYINNDIFKDTTISINNDNSNVSDFLAFLPSRLEYNISAVSNPTLPGFKIDSSNFVSDDSKIDVDFEFALPLWFKADSFALEDTVDMDLTNIEDDADFIERVNIMLEVTNGLPLDIDFQIYFLDQNYNPVDTLFAEDARPVISSGMIDPVTNEVIASTYKPTLVEFTKEDLNKLNTVMYGLVRAGLKTPSDDNGDLFSVKFFTDYSIDFNLSIGIDVKADL